jgi:hypothetical protein
MKPEMLVIWRQWGEGTTGTEFHLRTQAVTQHLPLSVSAITQRGIHPCYVEIIKSVSNIKQYKLKSALILSFVVE